MNWKVFWSYLKAKASKGLNKKKEFYFAISLSTLVFIGVVQSVQPFAAVMQFGDYLTASWETKTDEAPVPHAEKLTIPQLVEKLDGLTTEQALNRLKNNQVKVNSLSENLLEIGINNNKSPIEIYKLINYKPVNDLAGTGFGIKPLSEVAVILDMDINKIIDLLKSKGIEASETESIKDLAKKNKIPAKKIYEFIKE